MQRPTDGLLPPTVDEPLSDPARPRGRYAGYTRARLKAYAERLAEQAHPERLAVARLEIAGPTGRIPYPEALELDYQPLEIGRRLGPLWATYWVRFEARVPEGWRGARVELHWDSRSEALLWLDGRSTQGLNPGRHAATLLEAAAGGESLSGYVEVACNGLFGAGEARWGHPNYQLRACEIRRFDPQAWAFFHDFDVLRQLEADREPPQATRASGGAAVRVVRPALDTTWAGRLLHDLNRVCNIADPADPATWPPARAILDDLLASPNARIAHELSAVGHAHLDTAWLWPIDETRRKAQRTFSTAVRLMDRYPEFKFACSQAFQHHVIEEVDPDLFARIKAKAAAGQWLPIGGAWVEPDCNIPWGESICRQFLYGQAYFHRTFGERSRVFWNPDVFGYDGQLPQLMRQAGMDRFLTQKLSWNRFTSPPHHSFRWRGIDGSEVLTHFPPADTYNGSAKVEELRYHAANYKDADRTSEGLYLFGQGDGGGGATEAMIESLRRLGDVQGVPRSAIRHPDAFFDRLEASAADFAVVEGELYFEYHRGTYTSQSEVKRLNRLCEARLQALEVLATAAGLAGQAAPSPGEIERLWRVVLTNQFHDILPGSSIGEVYERTRGELEAVAQEARDLAAAVLQRLAGPGNGTLAVNTLGISRAEVAQMPDGALAVVSAAPFSVARIGAGDDTVRLTEAGGAVRLENGRIAATLTSDGLLRSLVHKPSGREAMAGPGNRILLLDDTPTDYEAWDIDPFALETARDAAPAEGFRVVLRDPLRAEVRFERRLGQGSRLIQTVRLDAGAGRLEFDTEIDWRERRTLVKAMFPLAPRSARATYETMFGVAERPTHASTDAALAQYEVPAHRWADLSEPGFGVSLLSDARHGFSCFGSEMALTLVRGPTWPDAEADIGVHRLRYALYPHAGDWRAAGTVPEALAFARPLVWGRGAAPEILARPLVEVSPASVIVDTLKPAEDGDGWVVRLYESGGGRAAARMAFGAPVAAAWISNTLEDRVAPLAVEAGGCALTLRPFQIITLRVR